MSSNIFNKGVVSRSLSTEQTNWDDTLSIIRDYSRLADDAITETSPDMRQIAVGQDWYFWQHSTWLGAQDNTWLEYAWSQFVSVKSRWPLIIRRSSDEPGPQKILLTGQYPVFHGNHVSHGNNMTSETREYHWINSLQTRAMEDVLDENGNLPNQSDCIYKVIDLQDLEDGSLVNYFDSAKISTLDFLTPNLNIIDRILDSIKVGGIVMINHVAQFGALYEDALSAHEVPLHRANVRIVKRGDFDVYHLAQDEIGTILAYKTE